MMERPLFMDPESIRATLLGHKTQIRFPIKPQPGSFDHHLRLVWNSMNGRVDYPEFVDSDYLYSVLCPYGKKGDHLWIKETFRAFDDGDTYFRADIGGGIPVHADDDPADWYWASPLYMPRRVSRLLLEITDIWAERLQSISEEDALASGFQYDFNGSPIEPFCLHWDAIYAQKGHPWESDCYVWCIAFKVITGDTDDS